MKKEEFEDFVEEHLGLRPDFKKELTKAVKHSKREKLLKLKEIL